jgi:hypothetical protein
MHALDILRGSANTIAEAIGQVLRRSEFSCGDCERVNRCGRPPTDDCIVRAAQIERDPTGYQRRMKARARYWGIG